MNDTDAKKTDINSSVAVFLTTLNSNIFKK